MVGVHPDGGSTGVGYGAAGAEVETVHAGAQMAPVDPAAVEGEHANPFLTSCTRSAVDWSDVAGERRAQTQTCVQPDMQISFKSCPNYVQIIQLLELLKFQMSLLSLITIIKTIQIQIVIIIFKFKNVLL